MKFQIFSSQTVLNPPLAQNIGILLLILPFLLGLGCRGKTAPQDDSMGHEVTYLGNILFTVPFNWEMKHTDPQIYEFKNPENQSIKEFNIRFRPIQNVRAELGEKNLSVDEIEKFVTQLYKKELPSGWVSELIGPSFKTGRTWENIRFTNKDFPTIIYDVFYNQAGSLTIMIGLPHIKNQFYEEENRDFWKIIETLPPHQE